MWAVATLVYSFFHAFYYFLHSFKTDQDCCAVGQTPFLWEAPRKT